MTGQQLFELGLTREGDKYIFGALAPKDDPDFHGPFDCAEFASWLVYQATGKLYGCYNNLGNPHSADSYTGYWDRDANAIGKKVTTDEAARTPGAFILRLAAPGMTGHIVCSDGKGGTIEAASTVLGVVQSIVTGRRWDYGILPPGIDYTANNPVIIATPSTTIYRYKKPMMYSNDVVLIKNAMKNLHYDIDYMSSYYDFQTMYYVRQFQAIHGLVADGEVGPKTAAWLNITI